MVAENTHRGTRTEQGKKAQDEGTKRAARNN